jgi:hypothetical protein
VIKAWSYSRYGTWKKCARRARYQYVDKLDQGPKSRALSRGIEIHEHAENYLKAQRRPKKIPAALSRFETMFAELRGQKAESELEITFTEEWEPTGWFDADAWCRIKVDAIAGPRIIDFKTGRIYADHAEQLELYALAGFLRNPELETITGELWYLDSGDLTEADFTQDEVPALTALWEMRIKPMFEDRTFEPNPSPLCGWCPYSGKKGGPCDAG